MHNDVFKDLKTTMPFYDKDNCWVARRQINSETGGHWRVPEVDGTLSMKELDTGRALKDREVDALVAFLKTLTGKHYEPLLSGVTCHEREEACFSALRSVCPLVLTLSGDLR